MKGITSWLDKNEDHRLLGPVITYTRTNIGILIAFFLLFAVGTLMSPFFLTRDNWINVLRQISTNANLAIGVLLAIIITGIDLSGGSIIALSGCVSVQLIILHNCPIWLAIVCGCLSGVLAGFFNGAIIAYTGMPPFIVTLAMQNICRGAAYLVANGQPIRIKMDQFEVIGTGYVGIVPLPVIYTFFFLLLTFFILNKTRMGRHIYAVGGNREAARFSGIKIARIEILIYTFSGFLAAFAGVILSARMASGQPAVGLGYETDAIAAAVVGGASMSGGVGTIGGMFIGALVIGILSNIMNLLGINSFAQYIAKGIVILVAVYIDIFRKRKNRF